MRLASTHDNGVAGAVTDEAGAVLADLLSQRTPSEVIALCHEVQQQAGLVVHTTLWWNQWFTSLHSLLTLMESALGSCSTGRRDPHLMAVTEGLTELGDSLARRGEDDSWLCVVYSLAAEAILLLGGGRAVESNLYASDAAYGRISKPGWEATERYALNARMRQGETPSATAEFIAHLMTALPTHTLR